MLYQYGISEIFVQKLYDGGISVQELRSKGDFGLGAFDALDGESIIVDGQFYHSIEGKTKLADNASLMCFAALTNFIPDHQMKLQDCTYDILKQQLRNNYFSSMNYPIAIEVQGIFEQLTICSVPKQEKPYKNSIDMVIAASQSYHHQYIEGIMVGFYAPSYLRDLKATRFHLHFIDVTRQIGGHVLDFNFKKAALRTQTLTQMNFDLPQSEGFEKAKFKEHIIASELSVKTVKPAA